MTHPESWRIISNPLPPVVPYEIRRRRFWRKIYWFTALAALIAGASIGWWA